MNGDDEGTVRDDASAHWEELIRRILYEASARWDPWENNFFVRRTDKLDLSDSKADWFDFSNELLMRTMSERLLEAFQNTRIVTVTLGNKFFATMDEQQQRSFLGRIVALPFWTINVGEATDDETEKPAITIHTSALLDALAVLNQNVEWLYVSNFTVSNQSDVEALSHIILAKRKILQSIQLKDIECPVSYNKRDRDRPIGYLDPLLYASSRMERIYKFCLSTRTQPAYLSLVSTNAVRAQFGEGKRWTTLCLNGLGLNDSHCHTIAEGMLQTPNLHCHTLDLRLNPAISAQGYGTLLNIFNRTDAVDRIILDDKHWEAKFNLVLEMNQHHDRLEYMMNGTFTSEESKWQWLFKLASLPSQLEDEAVHINYIWYTLCENPEILQT